MPKKQNEEAELIFSMVMKLGQGNYSDSTKSVIWAECNRNVKIRNIALQYLAGNSNRAELNLYRLHTAIVEEFFTDPVTKEVTL